MNKYVTNLTLPNGTNLLIKDSECRTNLSNEITRATEKETGLQQAINDETNRATEKETWLQNLIESINDAQHPVGSIYISTSSTFNPQTAWGGTWKKTANGRCLIGASTEYPLGSTGGEATHSLTTDEMPSHYHGEMANNSYTGAHDTSFLVDSSDSGNITGFTFDLNKYAKWAIDVKNKTGSTLPLGIGDWSNTGEVVRTELSGGSIPHNNMQPYLSVYIWERII